MEEQKHAMLSPSGAHRWMVCVGAPAMEYGLADQANEYSDEGTCAHKVAAMCFAEKRPATAYIGRRVEVGPCRTYEFRDDMAEPVQIYVDMVESLPGEKFYEVALPIGHLTGEPGAEGTGDVVSMTDDGEEIIVVDLKFGQGVFVKAEKNKQGMTYALGALKKYDVLGTVKRVRILIHQPRISEAASEWDCSVEELLVFANEVKSTAKVAMHAVEFRANWIGKPAPYEFLTPGEEQCKFCKAKATCPALASFVAATLGADFETLAARKTTDGMLPVDAEVLSTKLKATGLIEDWIKAIRGAVESALLQGTEIPGFKIVQGRMGHRKWSDPDAAEKLLKSFRLRDDEMYKLELISPTRASEIGPKIDKKTGVVKEKQPEDLKIGVRQWPKLAALIVRDEGKKSVAPTDDPRAAIEMKPLDDFEDLTAQPGADLV